MKKIIIFVVFLCLLVGCKNADGNIYEASKIAKTNYKNVIGSEFKDLILDENLALALLDFSFDSSSKILKNENSLYSPISFFMALAMLSHITSDNTSNEIVHALKVNEIDSLEDGCYDLIKKLSFENRIGKLSFANSIWLNRLYTYKNEPLKILAEKYFTSSYSVDFKDKNTKNLLTEWALKNTGGKIGEGSFDDLKPETMIVLLNAIYFYDEWKDTFEPDKTIIGPFNNSEETFDVKYMNQILSTTPYFKNTSYMSTSIRFKNDNQMVFVLPNNNVSVEDIIKDKAVLNESIMSIFSQNRTISDVYLKLPKFSFKSNLNLIDAAKAMGINEAFTNRAQFDSISDEDLFVYKIKQDSTIKVDEKGCEASSVTRIDVNPTSSGPSEYANFIIDRPFIFAILSPSRIPLFIGVVVNPDKA